jgi:hypothetical protein
MNCLRCHTSFEASDADQAFYGKISPVINGLQYLIPSPDHCPDCRQQRRMVWRNERTLYNRKCDLCQKEVISIYHADTPFPVYCPSCFTSDQWDGLSYGQDYDFSVPFFMQYAELQKKVPMTALHHERENENCEYTNLTSDNKNCYLVFAAANNEFAFYTTYLQRCRDISDCFFIFDSELCYECIDCNHCYNLRYSQGCQNCSDSTLLFDCKACKDCFGCVNLRNKQYYIFNQPYSKEDYLAKIKTLTTSRELFEQARSDARALRLKLPHKYFAGYNNENFTGDHIFLSKNSFDCFDSNNLEDCRWCTWMTRAKDCYDCYAWGNTGELGYENHLCGNSYYNVQFSDACSNDISNLMYCECVRNSAHDLFGCISLFRKEYCILNKQYSKEEYFALLPKIIQHMQGTREWGRPLPMALSRFAYNESIAQEYRPLTKGQALAIGSRWRDEEIKNYYQGPVYTVPYAISEVPDTILKEILTCGTCQKNYRIIHQELSLYRKLQVAIPQDCFACRYQKRLAQRNPRHLWSRSCDQCQVGIASSYAPDRPEKVLCEPCYQSVII